MTFAVVRTTSPATIGRDKAALQRRLSRIVDGGLWTIETGRRTVGTHLNLLIGSAERVTAGDIAAGWKSEADIYAEEIDADDARQVGAYISKKDGIPGPDQFAGRTYGSWGSWRTPLQAAAGQRISPQIAAAAMEYQLHRAGIPAPPDPPEGQRDPSHRFSRLRAVAEGRLQPDGMIYVPGRGLITRQEAWDAGVRIVDETLDIS